MKTAFHIAWHGAIGGLALLIGGCTTTAATDDQMANQAPVSGQSSAADQTPVTGQIASYQDNLPAHQRLGDSPLSPFYTYDAALKAPGALLRQEAMQPHQSNPGAAQNIRLLYSSTEGLEGEELIAVSGALFLPQGTPPAGGWPLLSWTHGTVGIADICSPSWNGRQKQDQDYLAFFLEKGFAVVASDYQGLGTPGSHPYLATRPEAYSNLDIIRAVQSADFPVSDRVVLFGQSQGAGAAFATAAYAKEYADDVQIAGVVATGIPFFSPKALIALQAARPRDRADPMLGYNLLALTLIQHQNPDFAMQDYINASAMDTAQMVYDTCYKDIRARVSEEKRSYNQVFHNSPAAVLEQAFSLMGFPTLQLDAPVFIGTGGKDRDTPKRMQGALVAAACRAGTKVQWQEYPDLDHRGVVPGSTGDSLPFIRAAFAGEEIEGNCSAQ